MQKWIVHSPPSGFFVELCLSVSQRKKTNKQANKQKSGFSIAGAVSAGFSYFCKSWRLFSDVVNFAWINNGNRTKWSPIRPVIIQVILKSNDHAAGVWNCNFYDKLLLRWSYPDMSSIIGQLKQNFLICQNLETSMYLDRTFRIKFHNSSSRLCSVNISILLKNCVLLERRPD